MTLSELGKKYNTDKYYLHNFCDFYERNLKKDIKNLWEIGILDGASLRMWSEYYPKANIVGFDINDKSNLEFNERIKPVILDQSNIYQLVELSKVKDIDIIIDDGSHIINHQIMTFEILFDSLKSGGQYIIEDLHTSTELWSTYGYENNKGTLQYLNDIITNIVPTGYPGQIRTKQIIDNIADIKIFTNIGTDKGRSITSIIEHK